MGKCVMLIGDGVYEGFFVFFGNIIFMNSN